MHRSRGGRARGRARERERASEKVAARARCLRATMAAAALAPGARVRIQGMTGATHLNGQTAVCASWDAAKERWLVRLDSGEEKLVRPANLEAIRSGGYEACGAPAASAATALSPGDLVRALPDAAVEGICAPGDEGTVQSVVAASDGELRAVIVWASSGKALSMRKEDWASRLVVLRQQRPGPGDAVEALPGQECIVDGVEFYKAGDEGIVLSICADQQDSATARDDQKRLRVLWSRTQKASDLPFQSWMSSCRLMRTGDGKPPAAQQAAAALALSPGDLVRAQAEAAVSGICAAGDEGTVQSIIAASDGDREPRALIVWASTGKALSMRKADWAARLVVLRRQRPEPGDTVEALPGQERIVDGVEYYKAGDEGIVLSICTDQSDLATASDEQKRLRVLWSRTRKASDLPFASWMSSCRLARKGDGKPPPEEAAATVSPLKPGVRATLQHLKAAPELNGKLVKLERFDALKGRWLVTIVTDELVVAPIEKWIKPDNLFVG
eukprot:TRINITY_DN1552_c0_g1_i1.p1 TRINITY_DN1552_c0_g1~~TRINITY_DN1552_c0_g1_i1.p1  ORF type:complete len:501 (+),score=132.93 TRINITY_DN1552_c0_g1_i1:1158-2660(+)